MNISEIDVVKTACEKATGILRDTVISMLVEKPKFMFLNRALDDLYSLAVGEIGLALKIPDRHYAMSMGDTMMFKGAEALLKALPIGTSDKLRTSTTTFPGMTVSAFESSLMSIVDNATAIIRHMVEFYDEGFVCELSVASWQPTDLPEGNKIVAIRGYMGAVIMRPSEEDLLKAFDAANAS